MTSNLVSGSGLEFGLWVIICVFCLSIYLSIQIHSKMTKWSLSDSNHKFGEGNGTPLQYSCLENPMDGGAWWAAVHGVPRSRAQLSDVTFTFHFHALEKEMANHTSVLAWRIPGMVGWAAIYGVTQSRTRLKWLSSNHKLSFPLV